MEPRAVEGVRDEAVEILVHLGGDLPLVHRPQGLDHVHAPAVQKDWNSNKVAVLLDDI